MDLEAMYRKHPLIDPRNYAEKELSEEEKKELEMETLKRKQEQWVKSCFSYLDGEFGKGYSRIHRSSLVVCRELVSDRIHKAIHDGTGSFFLGAPKNGKTHILIEMFLQILLHCWREMEIKPRSETEINTSLSGLARFYYLPALCEKISKREALPIARYVFLDEWGVENPNSYVLTGLTAFMERVQQQGGVIIATSCANRESILQRKYYERINAKLRAMCQFVTLPCTSGISGEVNHE
jgi:hypothetical protein